MSTPAEPRWEYRNPVRIVAGDDALQALRNVVHEPARWLLMLSPGARARGLDALVQRHAPGLMHVHDAITPNPDLEDMERLIRQYRATGLQGIVAVGGGSVIDAAKVLAIGLSENGDTLADALRAGNPGRWTRDVHLVAIPTTAGTGSEVTPFATVWDHERRRKHSVGGDAAYPDLCLLDASLTLSLPPDQTLYTALDATSHALESLWNAHRTPISESFAYRALELITASLPGVLRTPRDLALRRAMQHASTLAGLAISQTRTAIAHSISYPLTLRFGIPHGLACSFTLSGLLERHLDDLSTDARVRDLLERTRSMLDALPLREHMRRYADPDAILALRGEMVTPERAGNFRYREITSVEEILRSALT